MASYTKLITFLERDDNQRFLLVAHERPDGDTVSATLAMARSLKLLGKKITVASSQGVPEVFKYLPDWRDAKDDFLIGDFDAIILIDNGDLKRTGYSDRIIKARDRGIPIINIDHHPKNDIWKYANINVVDETASSTCEIIFGLFRKMNIDLETDIATMLLTGIYTDTGGFQHANVSAKTFSAAAELMSHGAKLKNISTNISNHKSLSMLKLWGIALDRIVKLDDIKLVYSIITCADIESVGASDQDLAGVVNLISTIPDDVATLLLYETPDGKIKGSLRTESAKVDVARIASLFGGGGHKRAAGFVIEGKLEKTNGGWKIV
ncbi:MAG: bifunctional oligoribonuclease/PAP phosphatase NrnA [Candidatus Berkelbacteria bacterium]|nr:bifunctional oligoribonuclease/PAP phosphatase NrnA [Candidatus Berkelbacteria bacterium]